ncbi:unnamed protein product [Soboliphyme baturini]|uniref:SCP domain-containing protein n=1 Tax=Soboliphyme baturini TaxID=241478 RepID=A0A183IW23_9BILA|nr:unnamed protein product [Soboliphyme baturini]
MVAEKTSSIGCAFAVCWPLRGYAKNNYYKYAYFVCNYSPMGNWIGEAPYESGNQECTEAGYTRREANGLCSSDSSPVAKFTEEQRPVAAKTTAAQPQGRTDVPKIKIPDEYVKHAEIKGINDGWDDGGEIASAEKGVFRQSSFDHREKMYDLALANYAQNFVASCVFKDDVDGVNVGVATLPSRTVVTPELTTKKAAVSLTRWFNEMENFIYESNSCAADTGCKNFRQMIAQGVEYFGCGIAECAKVEGTAKKYRNPKKKYLYFACKFIKTVYDRTEPLYEEGTQTCSIAGYPHLDKNGLCTAKFNARNTLRTYGQSS